MKKENSGKLPNYVVFALLLPLLFFLFFQIFLHPTFQGISDEIGLDYSTCISELLSAFILNWVACCLVPWARLHVKAPGCTAIDAPGSKWPESDYEESGVEDYYTRFIYIVTKVLYGSML